MRYLLIAALLVACQEPAAPHKEKPATAVPSQAKSANNFALDLWAKMPPGPLAISPPSVTVSLAMAWSGAKGTTADEMRRALRFEGSEDVVLSRWGQLYKSLKLEIANRMFADQHHQLDPIFFDVNMQAFGTRTDVMDFQGDAEGVRTKINTWVGKAAHISDMVSPGAVTAESQLVIVNATSFSANAEAAKTYRYAHAGGAALLEVPLGGTSMYVLLPDGADGLPAIETKLADSLRGLQARLADESVHVVMPAIKLETATLDLVKPLQALGIHDAFDRDKADFSGISKDRLALSTVLHRASVQVGELSTDGKVSFVADHPFLFVIVDRASGVIVVVGRVVKP